MQSVIERSRPTLPPDVSESLSDLLASMLVAEWRRQHDPRCNPQGELTVMPPVIASSSAYDPDTQLVADRVRNEINGGPELWKRLSA